MPLSVSPLEARLLKDKDIIGKMDPYCIVSVGNEVHKTKVHNNGGLNPRWSETFQFTERHDVLKITVKEKDLIGSEMIGEGAFNISRAYTHPNQAQTFPIDISYKGKPAGGVLVRVVYNF